MGNIGKYAISMRFSAFHKNFIIFFKFLIAFSFSWVYILNAGEIVGSPTNYIFSLGKGHL